MLVSQGQNDAAARDGKALRWRVLHCNCRRRAGPRRPPVPKGAVSARGGDDRRRFTAPSWRRQLTATQLVEEYLKRIAAITGLASTARSILRPASSSATSAQERAGQLMPSSPLIYAASVEDRQHRQRSPICGCARSRARAGCRFARTGRIKGRCTAYRCHQGPVRHVRHAQPRQAPPRIMRTTGRRVMPKWWRACAKAGAIILAKANMGEYASGDRSTFGGTTCQSMTQPQRRALERRIWCRCRGQSLMCALGEETGPRRAITAANNKPRRIVATHSLVSRAGLVPASLSRDRPASSAAA